jgi:hypothetical protein
MMGELPPPRLGAQADVQFLVEAAESASRAAPAPVNSVPRFAAHYQNSGRDAPAQAFATLIEGIDKSLGDLLDHLEKLGVAENTLIFFLGDNGSDAPLGHQHEVACAAPLRGKKGAHYEGGHRVPFIAHWPAAGWDRKHASDILCHAVDIVPTLLEITGAKKPAAVKFDGLSIRALLDPAGKTGNWPHDRMLVTDSQRVRDPIKWKQTAVMSAQWRLVNGRELYDLKADPGQERNVIAHHAAQADKMRAFYDAWWAELEPTFAQTTEIHLGHPDHPVVSLTGHDWIQEGLPPWNQQHIREAEGYAPAQQGRKSAPAPENPSKSVHRGHWAVKVVTPGSYAIGLRRWPLEADQPITAACHPARTCPAPAKPSAPAPAPPFRPPAPPCG